MITNRELIEGALKRVNAKLGCTGKLYRDNTGYFIIDFTSRKWFDEVSRSTGETLAYLQGMEQVIDRMK